MKRIRRTSRVGGTVALLATVLCLAPQASRAMDTAGVLARLQLWLDGTRDLACGFEQSLSSGALGAGIEEAGRLYVLRPGRMRWDYLDPERKVALVEGDRTRVYLEEEAQLWEGRLEDDALLVALLAGERPLAEAFEAALLPRPHGARDRDYRLRLVPREQVDSFRQVVLTLDAADFAIRAAEVLDGSGNLMEYRFAGLERNAGLSESVFHFEPPAGTEWVRP